MGPGIIDSHVHVGFGTVPIGPEDPVEAFRQWRRRATSAGISSAVLMAAPVGDYGGANRLVARLAASQPGRWPWYVFVNTVTGRGRLADIIGAAHQQGACGVKVHWSDGPATDEAARAARRHHMPVLFDPAGDIRMVAGLAQRHQDVPWVIPHLSSFNDDVRAQSRLIDLLVSRRNVFADTSGVRYFELLQDAVDRAGAHKILFGSDGPFLHPAPELAKVRALRLHPADRALILRDNVLRLTRAVQTPPRRSHVHLTA